MIYKKPFFQLVGFAGLSFLNAATSCFFCGKCEAGDEGNCGWKLDIYGRVLSSVCSLLAQYSLESQKITVEQRFHHYLMFFEP